MHDLLHTYRHTQTKMCTHTQTRTHTRTQPQVICIWVTAYLISENQSRIAFFPPLLSTGVSTLILVATCTKSTQEVFCLRQALLEFLVIHQLVPTSRQKRPSSFNCHVVCFIFVILFWLLLYFDFACNTKTLQEVMSQRRLTSDTKKFFVLDPKWNKFHLQNYYIWSLGALRCIFF